MIWWLSVHNHNFAIDPWVRFYTRRLLARPLFAFLSSALIGVVMGGLFAIGNAVDHTSPDKQQASLYSFFVSLPWLFMGIDVVFENRLVSRHLKRYRSDGRVTLATRAEYLGGHPELPHGRFVYVTVDGWRSQPRLSLRLRPGPVSRDDVPQLRSFRKEIPLRDVERAVDARLHEEVAALLQSRPRGLFGSELGLEIRYNGPASRRYLVELGHFAEGETGLRQLRNFVVCHQAEAEAAVEPLPPWKKLTEQPPASSEPAREVSDGHAGQGPAQQRRRPAFTRR